MQGQKIIGLVLLILFMTHSAFAAEDPVYTWKIHVEFVGDGSGWIGGWPINSLYQGCSGGSGQTCTIELVNDSGWSCPLIANADSDSKLAGWTVCPSRGGVYGSGACTVPGPDQDPGVYDQYVTVAFTTPGQYAIGTATRGGGTVELDPPGYVYDEGESVTLTAIPDAGKQFYGWEVNYTIQSSVNPLVVTVNSDKLLKAVFTDLDDGTYSSSNDTSSTPTNSGDGGGGGGCFIKCLFYH